MNRDQIFQKTELNEDQKGEFYELLSHLGKWGEIYFTTWDEGKISQE